MHHKSKHYHLKNANKSIEVLKCMGQHISKKNKAYFWELFDSLNLEFVMNIFKFNKTLYKI